MSLLDLDLTLPPAPASLADDLGGGQIRYGEYLLLIKATIFKMTSKGRCAVLRFHVLEARAFEGVDPPNPVGSDCSVVINFDGERQRSAEFRLHLFICGLCGVPLRSASTQQLTASVRDLLREKDAPGESGILEANPVRGMLIRLRLLPGQPSLKYEWGCAARLGEGANTYEEARKRVSELALSGDFTSESPVEKMVFSALCARGALGWQDGCVIIRGNAWHVFPQYEELFYRLDFALFKGDTKVAFEVDGFTYHDRTQEQAQWDRKRDRDLQAAGWLTPRFTASEIEEDVARCLTDVFGLVGLSWT